MATWKSNKKFYNLVSQKIQAWNLDGNYGRRICDLPKPIKQSVCTRTKLTTNGWYYSNHWWQAFGVEKQNPDIYSSIRCPGYKPHKQQDTNLLCKLSFCFNLDVEKIVRSLQNELDIYTQKLHYYVLGRHTFWVTWGRLLSHFDASNSIVSLLSSLPVWDVDALLFVELTSTMLTSEFFIRYKILICDRIMRNIGMSHAIINNVITYKRSSQAVEKLSKVQPRKYA